MQLLQRISECLDSAAARNICLEQFRAAGKMGSDSVVRHCADTLATLRQPFSDKGIALKDVSDEEIARFVKGAKTKAGGSISAAEYQELVSQVAKYAALRARRHPRTRWTLGVALSAAGAVAISAVLPVAAAASTGLMVAAAPVGAVVGAVALTLDGRSLPKRDRRRALRHRPCTPLAAEPPAAAEIAEAEQDSTVLVAAKPVLAVQAAEPAAAAAIEPLASSSGSKELISAVVEVGSAADGPLAAAKADEAGGPTAAAALPVATSAFSAAATAAPAEDEETAAVAAQLLPELARCPSPEVASSGAAEAAAGDSPVQPSTPGSAADASAFDGAVAASLPPLAIKTKGDKDKEQKPVSSTKALKKGLSKSFKSVKRALSLNSTGSGELRASLDLASSNGSITTPSNARPPAGPAGFLKRTFSKDSSHDVASLPDKDSGMLAVQASEGSATLRKMRDALRRSLTISTPRASSRSSSMDSAL